MKKITLVFAMLATIVLSSCGNQGSTESTEVVDTTEVVSDTVVVEEVEVVGGGAESVEVEATQGEAVK
jgi:ABC-type Zn uptake system ZnuABC Zn-binding protein ZnuA